MSSRKLAYNGSVALSCCQLNTRLTLNLRQIMEVQNNNSIQDQNGNSSKPLLSPVRVFHGDCLEIMKSIPDASIDMILCDLPYNVTGLKWDSIIPFNELWYQYERIIKPSGAIVLTAMQPFTTELIYSNKKMFKYTWVWNKVKPGNFLTAKLKPMQSHEDVLIFSKANTANGSKVFFSLEDAKEFVSERWNFFLSAVS